MLEKNEKRITKIAQNPNVEFVGIPCSVFYAEKGELKVGRGWDIIPNCGGENPAKRGEMLMKQFSYVLTNQDALQTRPMGNLMREASRFSSRVRLINGAKTAALSELRAVMGLDMNCGSRITVTVEGKDEEAAVAAIQNYFVDHM